jgi:transposase-like protein
MDPQTQFCHNPACPARGQVGQGNIRIHSRKERRYRCTGCGRTFAATSGTVFFRLRTAVDVVTVVLTLLCHGCPLQAIVAALGLDERTVAAWQRRAGQHCQAVHQHLVAQGHVDLEHVQADELYVKQVGGRVWMALALAVPSRLWLGGVISPQRDCTLITTLVQMVRACTRRLTVVVCVDGLSSYVTAFGRVFRTPVRTGQRGRPRLERAPGFLMGQVVKHYAKRHLTSVVHRAVCGTLEAITRAVCASGGGTTLNTAYIERLNATFRSALAPLVRRGRAIARQPGTLTAGMWLVGTAYNFCWEHESLRLAAGAGTGRMWQERTPAMAANLTDHRWSLWELLTYQIPLPAWVAPKRRGRPPKQARPPLQTVAACHG